MLFTDLPFDCLIQIFEFVPFKDQVTCVEVWPEWRGHLLLSYKRLQINESCRVIGIYGLSENIEFGEKGFTFYKLLNMLSNLQELDVVEVLNRFQKQIVDNIGAAIRKLRIIKLGWSSQAMDDENFKRMVNKVPHLQEFKGSFTNYKNTNNNVRYLLCTAKELHSVDFSGSRDLTSDVFKDISLRLKVIRAHDCRNLSIDILDHILESSRDTLQELDIYPLIPNSRIQTLQKFKNLKVISQIDGPDQCLQPVVGATEVSCLCDLRDLQKIYVRGCFHDEDIIAISRSWRNMRDLKLHQMDNTPHQPSHNALMSLRHLKFLEKLDLKNIKNLTDDHIKVFSGELIKLEELGVRKTSVTREGLTCLAELPTMKDIRCDLNIYTSGSLYLPLKMAGYRYHTTLYRVKRCDQLKVNYLEHIHISRRPEIPLRLIGNNEKNVIFGRPNKIQ